MKNTVSLYKPIGMTPLECIRAFQSQFPEYQDQKIAYAGRLDPMAEGVLLLLIGDECKNRTQYQLLPKAYSCTMLLGLTSDTYDALGKISVRNTKTPSSSTIKSTITSFIGSFEQSYPPYSSVRVNSKPLFYWTRKDKLANITIPKKSVTISDVIVKKIQKRPAGEVITQAIENIKKVNGDFRQDEIILTWKHAETKTKTFTTVNFEVSCSSGTYIRSLVNSVGEKLRTGALVFSLIRTRVGPFQATDAVYIPSLV